ncbi:MAG: preprotein translocase subunit SecA [Clostridiales bacterium]|nr:preprotein translocase subunit SecA [Clostridiales bacterium]
MSFFDSLLGNTSESRLKKLRPYVARINSLEPEIKRLSDAELRGKTAQFKERLKNGETLDDIMCEAFAVVREAAVRTVNMRHFDVQLLGGMVLHQGRIAEMKTGEGKTLVATLPAYLNALNGKGVHIVTVNDYLAHRDAQWMGKIHRFLGLSVGCIVHDLENDERRAAYAADITYGTNNEFGFDYLRDNMVVYREQMVQRDLEFAIVDEVDSILIDEARTPLIISGIGEESSEMYEKADRFVQKLQRGANLVQQSKADYLMGEEIPEDGDYQCDIKRRTVQLTAQGIRKAEQYFGIDSLADPDNAELNHYILQALRARSLFVRDRDYVVQDGQVIIVDEFTGRLMIGRRYNEGLHQALEAKEGVKVEHENKTLATITFQNYFRMFKKLAGMTGTAKTEESEFMDIYDLDVVEIPTNMPMIREDMNDVVYSTEEGKFRAVIREIEQYHATGQPVLVGTISVEKSEYLSQMLKRKGIRHEVLNAKYHAKEAEIVAQAGKLNQVTIATNMAGRGTDILLGGNPDFLARRALRQEGMEEDLIEEATSHADTDDADILAAREKYNSLYEQFSAEVKLEHQKVVSLGGLHIIGTERHESRRIDNQLRGRAGRQGDPGSTRFYVSLEDDLMRRFGADRISGVMEKLNPDDDVPIEAKIISKQIENAQKRVESSNFEIRKNVLRYDDVMNKQREIIYGQRRRVLMGEDVHDSVLDMLHSSLDSILDTFASSHASSDAWDLTALSNEVCDLCFIPKEPLFSKEEIMSMRHEDVRARIYEIADKRYREKEQEITSEGGDMREVERVVLLRTVDSHWMDHIDAMDQLKQGIGLRAYGQRDPVNAYTAEGFEMFDTMVEEIREQTAKTIFRISVRKTPVKREQVAKPVDTPSEGGNKPVRKSAKAQIGRNDPCPCGSGKKYKNCCGKGR